LKEALPSFRNVLQLLLGFGQRLEVKLISPNLNWKSPNDILLEDFKYFLIYRLLFNFQPNVGLSP